MALRIDKTIANKTVGKPPKSGHGRGPGRGRTVEYRAPKSKNSTIMKSDLDSTLVMYESQYADNSSTYANRSQRGQPWKDNP